MNSFSFKVQLIKLDIVVADIRKIHSTIPSEYGQPKKILAGAYAEVRTNPKKALKIATKAKALFVEESVIAMDYNGIRDEAVLSNDSDVIKANEDYLHAIRDGDYRKARKAVDKLKSSVGVMTGHSLSIKYSSVNGDATTVSIVNGGNKVASIVSMSVVCGGSEVETSVHAPLSIGPASQVLAVCRTDASVNHPLEFMLEYYVEDTTWTLSAVVNRDGS